jgi:acetyl-CoA carboxylase biotin carboxyl carrier protein
MELTDEDVADILALLDSSPYDELDLRTARFRLTLRRDGDGWTRATQLLTDADAPAPAADAATVPVPAAVPAPDPAADEDVPDGLVPVIAPLPGTFYRAPRPGASPYVEVGSEVTEESVVGIVETMKLMNPVHAGARGRVAQICVANGEFAARGATLVRIEVGA